MSENCLVPTPFLFEKSGFSDIHKTRKLCCPLIVNCKIELWKNPSGKLSTKPRKIGKFHLKIGRIPKKSGEISLKSGQNRKIPGNLLQFHSAQFDQKNLIKSRKFQKCFCPYGKKSSENKLSFKLPIQKCLQNTHHTVSDLHRKSL